MSETTPDPADVHTGTDRVELTEAERAEIDCGCGGFADGAIERVIGARLASLIAARDRLRVQLEQVDAKGGIADLFGERDMWRKTAERYAARVQALTAERDRLRVDTNINADEVERQRRLLDLARAELAAANARCAELEAKWLASDQRAERNGAAADALQATLDRVTAAIKSSKHKTTDHEGTVTGYLISDAEFRAAVTPEGKP